MRNYLKQYISVMTCPFYMHEGGIFAVWDWASPRRIREHVKKVQRRQVCYTENDWNRYHFELILTKDRWQNFLENTPFAYATLVAWRNTLAGKKEKADRRIFVSNRLMSWQDRNGFVAYHVLPTLHLWTTGPGSDELEQLYHYSESGPEVVWDMDSTALISLKDARERVEAPPVWDEFD